MPKKITVLGPPGAGKGTQASRIADTYNIPHISTGEILRNNKDLETEYGTPREYIDKGDYVPDEMMKALLEKRLNEDDTDDGFVLDGFPRNVAQAEYMDDIGGIDIALYLNVDEDTVIERLKKRRTCEACGENYHKEHAQPAVEGTCDECDGELKRRSDDKPEIVENRIETYRQTTEPVVDYYRDRGLLHEVNANPGIATVWKQVRQIIDSEYGDDT